MKVLLADDNRERIEAVSRHLAASGVDQIITLAAGQRLIDAVNAGAPDVVIVDMSRPDRDSLEGIREVSARSPRPIVLFVNKDNADFMEQAIDAGVSSYNVMGSAIPDVKPIVQAAVAIFRRYQKVADNLQEAQSKLGERDLIQRAKAQLMKERRMTEPQAYSHLRKTAMNQGKRLADIAAEILQPEKKP